MSPPQFTRNAEFEMDLWHTKGLFTGRQTEQPRPPPPAATPSCKPPVSHGSSARCSIWRWPEHIPNHAGRAGVRRARRQLSPAVLARPPAAGRRGPPLLLRWSRAGSQRRLRGCSDLLRISVRTDRGRLSSHIGVTGVESATPYDLQPSLP